ncbi:unnamed protein product [Calypogeia fissa]
MRLHYLARTSHGSFPRTRCRSSVFDLELPRGEFSFSLREGKQKKLQIRGGELHSSHVVYWSDMLPWSNSVTHWTSRILTGETLRISLTEREESRQ